MNDPKIIEVLDSAIRKAHGEGWDYVDLSIEDAREILAALRRDEPRVMTLEEVEKTDEWMWGEYVTGYCGWQRTDIEDDYLNMVAWNDNTVDRKDYYGKTWRCWSSRPSEQQMRDTKWEEPDV